MEGKGCFFMNFLMKALIISGVLIILTVIIPMFLIGRENPETSEEPPIIEINIPEEETIDVYFHREGEVKEISLEEYLVGVVAAEMPPSFHPEALKAQAVMARSYTYSRLRSRGGPGCDHVPSADICTDHNYCQAWISKEEAEDRWDDNGSLWQKVEQSVKDTEGVVLLYDGEPVKEAPYHSTCSGRTELPENYWSSSLPYVKSVDCPYCSHSPRLNSKEVVSLERVVEALNVSVGVNSLQSKSTPVEILERSEAGTVLQAVIGSDTYTGREIREQLGLDSANFSVTADDTNLIFEVTGYGHGIGLCQYGADGMGQEGYSYDEILDYYFTDIELAKLK